MTQKEYTGPEFEVEFKRADYEWAKGGKVGVDPSDNWQIHCNGDWLSKTGHGPTFHAGYIYRWKPAPKRMVTISYKTDKMALPVARTVVAPEVEAPAIGTPIYLLDKKPEVEWEDRPWLVSWLKAGLVFLTREDAQAMSDWIAVCRKGGQS